MKWTCGILFCFLFSLDLSAAPYTDPVVDTTKNQIVGAEYLSTAMTKLSRVKNNQDSTFVIAHFGDSHIQGDYFSGAIRTNLQSEFGNGGEGILFPYSLCKSFGPRTLTSEQSGTWTWSTVLKNPENKVIGITGYTLITRDSNATLSFTYNPETPPIFPVVSRAYDVIVWHSGENSRVAINGAMANYKLERDTTDYGMGLHRTIIHGYKSGEKIRLRMRKNSKAEGFELLFHGIQIRKATQSGVEYHRCAVVGATFLQLIAQQEFTIQHLKRVQPDLLIFSYGSNESYDTNLDMNRYASSVDAFIARLKKEFPEVNIVLMSPPDTRSRNRFPVNTQPITDSLRVIAAKEKCAYWNLNEVMGGDSCIYFWLDNSLARKDKLHFTKSGYELQGNLFTSALLHYYQQKNPNDKISTLTAVDENLRVQLSTLVCVRPDSITNTPTGTEQKHTVKSGETLSIIARNYGCTVDQLCTWNNIRKTDVIKVGQKLVIKK